MVYFVLKIFSTVFVALMLFLTMSLDTVPPAMPLMLVRTTTAVPPLALQVSLSMHYRMLALLIIPIADGARPGPKGTPTRSA